MEQFWFDRDAQQAPIGTLSGGERRRLQLLLVLAERPNVLLLDEPTNDLDLDTLRVLEDFLEAWPGSLVVVSHDRTLLERTVTDVIALDGAGRAVRVGAGQAAWAAPAAAAPPVEQPSTRPGRASPRVRSPSTLRRLVGAAEKEVAQLEAQRDQLTAALSTAGADYNAHAEVGRQLATVAERLAAAEHRWLELAEELGA
jgi:ATP-binding cassette subfamily F protein uup